MGITDKLKDKFGGGGDEGDETRAGPGEGVRAPLAQEGADHAEISIFDGKGNERVAALGTDEEGKMSEGTGPTSADAVADIAGPETTLGEDFGPGTEH